MTALLVEECGAGASIQDWGRTGFRRFGVATAGAMDRLSLAHANALVGNPPDAAAVEFVLLGGRFRVESASVAAAVSGPGVCMDVAGRRVAPGTGALAAVGETLSVHRMRGGVYGYLAVSGGLAGSLRMGSRSVHARSGIGGRPLAVGDRLAVLGMDGPVSAAPRRIAVPAHSNDPIRAVPGPQNDWFPPETLDRFFSVDWTLSARSDRMGCRLAGPRLKHAKGYNIVSDGVLAGSVQVPGDGRPLVLLRDCPTTGGYPKIATVITADLGRLAQLPPGAKVRLARATVAEAAAAARSLDRAIRGMWVQPTPGSSAAGLLEHNLVSGVVDAREGGVDIW